MKTIEENNRLIAEFMGLEKEKRYFNQVTETYVKQKTDECDINPSFGYVKNGSPVFKLKYHKSWKWLMPVVEKIESDERFDVEILQYGTVVKFNQKEIVNNVADIDFEKKIQHTYSTIVQFIEWYNENK